MLDISLLGTGGMMPMPNRFLSSMMLRFNGKLIVIDCGEGTQVTLKTLGWGFKAIEAICFTHYHADHISGLPGMLLTIGNSGRTEPLKLIGPTGLIDVVEGLRKIATELPFPIEYIEFDECNQNELNIEGFHIKWIMAEHTVKCAAYRIDIIRKGMFDSKKAVSNQVPKSVWSKLQKEGFAELDGKQYTDNMILGEKRKGICVSFCTDSRPATRLIDFIYKSDLFVCEGMYGENEKLKKARENKHMLFSEAAMLAKRALVNELWLTHYSPSISDPQEFISNATEIFENTVLGFDRMTKTLLFKDEK